MNGCCPCDVLVHPAKPDIPAGLGALPRQVAGFPEYRQAMLRDIRLHLPLSGWRAREGDDLGIMLLEMWAYVLDVLGFYDERIANEAYLRTAVRSPSIRRLVGVIGYRPRPALAASVVLAAIADGKRSVRLPPRTAFRSNAFDGEPPQVFEIEVEHTIHPLRNEWQLGPVRERTVGDRLLLDPDTARLARDQIAIFVWSARGPGAARLSPPVQAPAPVLAARRLLLSRPAGQDAIEAAAARVVASRTVEARDGQRYVELTVHPAPRFGPDVRLADVQVLSPTQSASISLLPLARTRGSTVVAAAGNVSFSSQALQSAQPVRTFIGDVQIAGTAGQPRRIAGRTSTIRLDAAYPQMQPDDFIVIARGSDLLPFRVAGAREVEVRLAEQATIPVTQLEVAPELPARWQSGLRSLIVHFNLIDGGTLTREARTHLAASDFAPAGVPIDGQVEPLPPGTAAPARLLLQDAVDHGVLADGTVTIEEDGTGRIRLNPSAAFDPALRTPVTVFGNLVRATRGESVAGEVLGSGEASRAFQAFTLARAPLTYFNEPSSPDGRRSTLEVRVNGIRWKEAPSFFGAGPHDEVYIVRQDDEGQSVVTFGDGKTGARLPTGTENVTASYRSGAGAAKPPAGAINQLARPVEGLRRVLNPVAAGGGADADRPKDIRRNAPASALILGRAVSAQDFEALAREFGGVVNARVEWAWDERCQRAVAKVWFISDGGDIARALRAFLIGQADPDTPLVVDEATALPSALVVDLDIDTRFNGQTVVEQVRQALTDPDTGILALENIPIGRPLFRSRLFEVLLAVDGVRSVRRLTVDGEAAPFAVTVPEGGFRNFLAGLIVAASAS